MLSAEKMGIIFIINSLHAGGAERVVSELARGIDKTRYEPTILCLHERGVYFEALKDTDVKVLCLDLPYKMRIKELLILKRYIEQFKPHIVQTFLGNPNRWGALAGKLAKVPTIVSSLRNCYYNETLIQKMFDVFCFQFVTHSISCAEAVKRFHVENKWYSGNKITTIHSGIDISRFSVHKNKHYIQTELGISTDCLILGTVASLIPQKGHKYLIEAAKEVIKNRNDVIFAFVGDGSLRAELEQMVTSNGLDNNIKFLGLRKDIPQLLSSFDVFVLPSLWEGLPVAVIEAMAAGLPVVASRVDGVPEIVVDGETGLLVPSKDPKSLSNALLVLLSNPDKRFETGLLGRKRVGEEFSVEAMVRKFDALYQKLLAKKSYK